MQESRVISRVEEKRVFVKGEGFVNQVTPIEFTAYQSRWGWHPVSYEDFQILKAIHKRYWETYRQACHWARWYRKEPQNRVLREREYSVPHSRQEPRHPVGWKVIGPWAEPEIDPLFIDKEGECGFYTKTEDGWGRGHYVPFRPLLGRPFPARWELRQGGNIVVDFQRVRKPVEDPEQLAPLDMAPYRAVWDAMTAEAV